MSLQDELARKDFVQDFVDQLEKVVKNNSELRVDGQLGITWGQVVLGDYIWVYTDFLPVNKMDIQFGRIGSVKGTPPELALNVDIVNHRWVDRLDQRQRFTNQELIRHCIERLYKIAKEDQLVR